MKAGHVSLVGAGPGDPALLTVRAAELIAAADVVAYDELISEAILALVPARAELLPVGRRVGAGEVAHRLHPAVKERALRGLRVVRLKAGDPLVFGRGGEEAEELVEAAIPFEIVPGVTAAIGAASYVGIPLTHRGLSAQVVLTSGHRRDGGAPPPTIVGGRTIVQYMAAHELAVNLAAVVAGGWPASTPAALIAAATTVDERVITATLGTLAAVAEAAAIPRPMQPALVVIGDVVALHAKLDWRRAQPLHGKLVVVARAKDDASEATRRLRDLGATVIDLACGGAADASPASSMPRCWPSLVDAVVVVAAEAATTLFACAPASIRAAPALAIDSAVAIEAARAGASDVRAATTPTIDALVVALLDALAVAR